MKKAWVVSAIASISLIIGSSPPNGANAADYYEDDYERIYQDRTYIDNSLDEFEKRNGKYRSDYSYDDEDRYNKYSSKDSEYKYNKDYSGKDGYKGHSQALETENCERPGPDERAYLQDNGPIACLHPRRIRRNLVKYGWHEFQILNENARRIRMLATDHYGRRFRLVLDRCQGAILRRQPLRRYSRRP